MAAVLRVFADEALREWDFFEALINRVLKRTRAGTSPDDVLTCIQKGDMQLWCDDERKAICITEIQTYPRFNVLLVYMVAGKDARDWLTEGQRQLDSFAQQSGCRFVEFIGRPGWEAFCRELGYTDKFIRMRKEI